MAYGNIHNKTGTICKAKSDATCPLTTDGGHSSNEDEYINTVSSKEGIDPERVKALISEGTPRQDAISVVKDSLDEARSTKNENENARKIGFIKPESNKAIGRYEMTDERLDLNKVHPGDRYYDSDGGAYIVETVQKGQTVTLSSIGSDGTVPRNTDGSDGDLRVDSTEEGSFLRKLKPSQHADFITTSPGHSESRSVKELPSGGSWPKSITAQLNYRDDNGDSKSIELVAPIGRLTDNKRIEIGKELWAFTGKDPRVFDKSTDKQKLNWINQRLMRRENYSWSTKSDGSVSYTHSRGSGGSHQDKEIKLLEL